MAKEKATAKNTSEPIETQIQKAPKPKAVEVAAALISSEVDNTVVPSRMPGSYLTVDPRMDSSPITVKFSAKEAPELVFEDIVDSSGQSGARDIAFPLGYLTKLMGFTARILYTGRSQGQAVASLAKEVGISFYPASESEALAPYLLHEKIVHNTPTYDMHDHAGDETVLVPVPPLAKKGDKVYCTAVTEQDAIPYTFYTVVYGHVLTEEEAVAGHVLKFFIARGWLARRKPWRSITLQSAWITSGLAAEPPADIDPHLETRLPANALEIQRRRTAALIVDHGLDLLPPHLRQSVQYNGGWCLNPELTKAGGNVDVPGFDSYADDVVCFHVSGPGFGTKPLGCVTIEQDGDLASIELSACDIACFFDKTMTLGYTVQFPNSEGSQPSPEQSVNVSVPQLPHSDIEEATQGTVDLVTFPGNATALVPVWSYAECSNRCWMWLIGKRAEGGTYRFDILTSEPVTDEWKNKGVEAFVLRAELQKLDDCSVFELHFAAGFCDTTDLAGAHEFPVQTFKIEQEPLVLLAPQVTEAVGSDLTAYNGRNGVHVEVNYVGNDPRHSISVCWKKPDGTCWPLASKPGSNTASVVFTLPAEAVIESMGKTVPITYTVTTACKLQTSLPLNLKITLPVRLEPPNVLEATPPRTQNAVLDLRAFAGNAYSLEDPMWFMREWQKCWLDATGTKKDGSNYSFSVYAARTVAAGEVAAGVESPVLRSELEKLRDGTALTLVFSIATDGTSVKTNAVVCPSRVLIIRMITTTFDDFNALPYGQYPAGTSIDTPTMTIRAQSGTVGIHAANPAVPGMTSGNAIALNCAATTEGPMPTQTVDVFFKRGYSRVRFSFTRNAYYGSFNFYSTSGALLGSRSGMPLNSRVDFSAPEGQQIGRMSATNQQHSYLDDFELDY